MTLRERLLLFFDPTRSLGLYLLGTTLIAILTSLLTELTSTQFGWWGLPLVAAILSSAMVAVVVLPNVRRRLLGPLRIDDRMRPAKSQGVILLVSPTPHDGQGVARPVLDYHLPTLKFCWLIATVGSVGEADNLVNDYSKNAEGSAIQFFWGKDYLVEGDSVDDTFQLVSRILAQEAPAVGVKPEHLIADLTGAQKPMTVGMALACLQSGHKMEYLRADRNKAGEVDKSRQAEPIQLEVKSQLFPGSNSTNT